MTPEVPPEPPSRLEQMRTEFEDARRRRRVMPTEPPDKPPDTGSSTDEPGAAHRVQKAVTR